MQFSLSLSQPMAEAYNSPFWKRSSTESQGMGRLYSAVYEKAGTGTGAWTEDFMDARDCRGVVSETRDPERVSSTA